MKRKNRELKSHIGKGDLLKKRLDALDEWRFNADKQILQIAGALDILCNILDEKKIVVEKDFTDVIDRIEAEKKKAEAKEKKKKPVSEATGEGAGSEKTKKSPTTK